MKTRSRRGFSLVELLVVMSIITILAAMLFMSFAVPMQRARDVQKKVDNRGTLNGEDLTKPNAK